MNRLIHGDSLIEIKKLADNSIDSIVTDPPAGISFMSQKWDDNKGGRDKWIEWMSKVATECKRTLKPGGHAFVWALPRTSHWTATAWENAGFEIRDVVAHVFGCLSDDTEILTESGYKLFKDILKDEKICIYDKSNNSYSYEIPTKWSSYQVENEDCYSIKSNETDQIVSKNHKCLVERNGKLEFEFAENLREREFVPLFEGGKVFNGDCLKTLKTFESGSVDCVVTSPPYWALRDYGVEGQLGLEPTFQEYISKLCDIFDEIKRVLKDEGTCWVNIGDTYGGACGGSGTSSKKQISNAGSMYGRKSLKMDKSLCCIPDRFKIEMINRGWICRNEIIWHKPNCMPSSVKDRFTVDYEKVFFFTKKKKYFFKQQYEPHTSTPWGKGVNGSIGKGKVEYAVQPSGKKDCGRAGNPPQGRNKRCVWKVNTKPYKEAHFATYPETLIEPMIDAGCPIGGVTLDPFFGAGTTGLVAIKQSKDFVGIELNTEYIKIINKRLQSKPKTTEATVTKIKYTGTIFCPTVSTGAFVARRNGKVFLTGNSGFPKSHNIGKSVSKLIGEEREVMPNPKAKQQTAAKNGIYGDYEATTHITKGTSEWEGWGTGLKPAREDWILMRKPIEKGLTIAQNCLKWQTGGINIDSSRVESNEDMSNIKAFGSMPENKSDNKGFSRPWMSDKQSILDKQNDAIDKMKSMGRFPANLIHDNSEEVRACFPETGKGAIPKGKFTIDSKNGIYGKFGERENAERIEFDSGNASRFFKSIIYQPKPSKKERNEDCEGLEGEVRFASEKGSGQMLPTKKDKPHKVKGNFHPTVKSIELMKYLITMITPPGGTVLDPFAGSGTTGVAAKKIGMKYILIEKEDKYIPIIEARLK